MWNQTGRTVINSTLLCKKNGIVNSELVGGKYTERKYRSEKKYNKYETCMSLSYVQFLFLARLEDGIEVIL